MKKIYISLIILLFLGFLFYSFDAEVKVNEIQYVKIGNQEVKVDLALSEIEKNKGLGGRESLLEDEGMLFVFDETGKYSFWMKDMKFAIDIIWIGENKEIIYIKKNATPESYPESFEPENPTRDTKYVLEVSAGFSEKNNLKIGDKIEFVK
jgi:uncharacterized membrane protein (UPF0127 family)